MKAIVIWDRMGDYHRARVKALRQTGLEVYTADLGNADALYQWKGSFDAQHTVLSNHPVEKWDAFKRFRNAQKLIDTVQPQLLACPYGRSEYHAIAAYARFKKIKTVFFCESWYSRGKVKDVLKGQLLRLLASYLFVSGLRAEKHVKEKLNYPVDRIKSGYSVVENSHFSSTIPFNDRPNVLLCIARFSPEKNLERLMEAFSKSKLANTWQLKIIGAGRYERYYQECAAKYTNIQLYPWVSYEDLPTVYAGAKALILPSTFEPWGLVVNEAIASGIPVLLSSEVGAIHDVYSSTMEKWVFVPTVTDAIRFSLDQLDGISEVEWSRVYYSQAKLLQSHTPENWAEKIRGCF
jgi:glycosyltransferase involved in cell wall biosynthesis